VKDEIVTTTAYWFRVRLLALELSARLTVQVIDQLTRSCWTLTGVVLYVIVAISEHQAWTRMV